MSSRSSVFGEKPLTDDEAMGLAIRDAIRTEIAVREDILRNLEGPEADEQRDRIAALMDADDWVRDRSGYHYPSESKPKRGYSGLRYYARVFR